MLIFSGSSNLPLAKKVAKGLDLKLSDLEIHTFPDKENRVRVIDRVLDQDVVVIQSTGISPNRLYMELFFILDSIKRSGTRSITLVIPYLGYQRQDHIFRDGEGVSLGVIVRLLEELGVSKVISFDLHSIKIPELFHVPIAHLSALPIFAKEIEKMGTDDLVLVSPDMGGIRRIKLLAGLLDEKAPCISIEKNRDLDSGEVESVKINGQVNKRAIIVDDVISTGQTLISAANLLKENGAQEIYVMATHGIFADGAPANLQNSPIEKVIISDSLSIPDKRKFDKLQTVSIADLIVKELRK